MGEEEGSLAISPDVHLRTKPHDLEQKHAVNNDNETKQKQESKPVATMNCAASLIGQILVPICPRFANHILERRDWRAAQVHH